MYHNDGHGNAVGWWDLGEDILKQHRNLPGWEGDPSIDQGLGCIGAAGETTQPWWWVDWPISWSGREGGEGDEVRTVVPCAAGGVTRTGWSRTRAGLAAGVAEGAHGARALAGQLAPRTQQRASRLATSSLVTGGWRRRAPGRCG